MKNLNKHLYNFEEEISSWCKSYGIKYEIVDVLTEKNSARIEVKFTHNILWLNEHQYFCLYEDGDVEIEMGEDNYDIMTEANFWISLLAQSKFERME